MWTSKIPATLAREHRILQLVIHKATDDVRGHARDRAPVDTGFLKNSIQVTFPDDLTGVVFVAAEYGIYVELGTRRMAARPYLRPALEAVIPALGGEIRSAFGK